MKELWQCSWRLLTRDKKTKVVTSSKVIVTENTTKLKALQRYFYMLYELDPKSKNDICELKIIKNGKDITSSINKWLASDRVC